MHITDKMRTNHENSRKTMVQNNIEKFNVKSPSKEHRTLSVFVIHSTVQKELSIGVLSMLQ